MKTDMLMAKTDEPGAINLAVGEPGCLQDAFSLYGLYEATTCMPKQAYPPLAATPLLLEELRQLHPRGEIVVAAGAKHALLAAIYAYRQIRSSRNSAMTVVHRAPYWPSHKTLAELVGCSFATTGGAVNEIRVNTSPNNPDGSIDHTPCDIWDAAYAHEVYNFDAKDTPPHETAVYSAAKLFGMSGDRVGWLVTSNPEVAKIAAAYVESTTSGVSIYSQMRVADVLWRIHDHPKTAQAAYDDVRGRMKENALSLEDALDQVIFFNRGMFAWLKADEALRRRFAAAKVRYLPGEACGKPGWARVNLGASDYLFDAAVTKLSKTRGA